MLVGQRKSVTVVEKKLDSRMKTERRGGGGLRRHMPGPVDYIVWLGNRTYSGQHGDRIAWILCPP